MGNPKPRIDHEKRVYEREELSLSYVKLFDILMYMYEKYDMR
jgi:hypothetical protein